MRRSQVLGLVLAAFAIIPLAGCQGPVRLHAQPSLAAAAATPIQSLMAAAARTSAVDFKLAARGDEYSITGAYDSKNKTASFRDSAFGLFFVASGNYTFVQGIDDIPADSYARMTVALMRPAVCNIAVAADADIGMDMATGIVAAGQTGPSTYSGVLDLFKVTATTPATQKAIEGLISKTRQPTSVPFTAVIDGAGYIPSFRANMVNAEGEAWAYELLLSEFGVANNIPIPTNFVEAPEYMYGVVSGPPASPRFLANRPS